MPANQHERRQELERIRRSFSSLRARRDSGQAAQDGPGPGSLGLGSLFDLEPSEPAPTTAPAAGPALPALPAARGTRWSWFVVPVVTLAIGVVLGFAVASGRTGGERVRTAAPVPSVTQPAPVPSTTAEVRPSASPACLETAKQGDQVIALLVTNQRQKARAALRGYTLVSQQCRKDAAPAAPAAPAPAAP
jgi:hypothetical protein